MISQHAFLPRITASKVVTPSILVSVLVPREYEMAKNPIGRSRPWASSPRAAPRDFPQQTHMQVLYGSLFTSMVLWTSSQTTKDANQTFLKHSFANNMHSNILQLVEETSFGLYPEDSMHGKTCLQQQPKDEQALVISSLLKTLRLHTVFKGRTLKVCCSNSIHIWERWLTQKEEWQDRTQWAHTTPSRKHLNYFKAIFLVQMTSQL